MPQTVYVSATPDQYEMSRANEAASKQTSGNGIVEQLVRPTGLIDPKVSVRPVGSQIPDLFAEIQKRVTLHERTLVSTLTKQMAEDLTEFLKEKGILVQYLNSDVQTLDRSDILDDLRKGTFDVIVGVNLLREGLDLPEVSLVAILDADKEGFLRSRTSLVQTMGRASRHVAGEVILYADRMTDSMTYAIEEVGRRRKVQLEFNKAHNITPVSIHKPIRDQLVERGQEDKKHAQTVESMLGMEEKDIESLTPMDKKQFVIKLTKEMRGASRELNFELAAKLRDFIATLTD